MIAQFHLFLDLTEDTGLSIDFSDVLVVIAALREAKVVFISSGLSLIFTEESGLDTTLLSVLSSWFDFVILLLPGSYKPVVVTS